MIERNMIFDPSFISLNISNAYFIDIPGIYVKKNGAKFQFTSFYINVFLNYIFLMLLLEQYLNNYRKN